MAELYGFDAFSPAQIAEKVESVGVTKAKLPALQTLMLGALAGAFIGLGALFSLVVTCDSTLPFGLLRVLGGAVFSLGLVLVVLAGAELFTGNNLLVMAWADRKISTGELLRNWSLVYFSNLVGAGALALGVWAAHTGDLNSGALGGAVVKLAAAKAALPFGQAFARGVLCNLLVCLAVWISLAGRSVTDKILAVVFPVSAFVAAGFEHSIANLFLFPLALLLKADGVAPQGLSLDALTLTGAASNLLPVTLGNIAGGGVLVALVYQVIYRRKATRP
jgi:formate/nitrite transporter